MPADWIWLAVLMPPSIMVAGLIGILIGEVAFRLVDRG